MVCPLFVETTVTSHSYLGKSEQYDVPQLPNVARLHQGGTHTHYGYTIRRVLKDCFPNKAVPWNALQDHTTQWTFAYGVRIEDLPGLNSRADTTTSPITDAMLHSTWQVAGYHFDVSRAVHGASETWPVTPTYGKILDIHVGFVLLCNNFLRVRFFLLFNTFVGHPVRTYNLLVLQIHQTFISSRPTQKTCFLTL